MCIRDRMTSGLPSRTVRRAYGSGRPCSARATEQQLDRAAGLAIGERSQRCGAEHDENAERDVYGGDLGFTQPDLHDHEHGDAARVHHQTLATALAEPDISGDRGRDHREQREISHPAVYRDAVSYTHLRAHETV